MVTEIAELINSPGFGVILGAAISILTTVLTNRYVSADKLKQRALNVTYKLRVQQLNLLVDLQKALLRYGRLNVQCQLSLLQDGLYAENGARLIDDGLCEELRLVTVEVNLLSSQIQAEHIRQVVDDAIFPDSLSNDSKVIESFMFDVMKKVEFAVDEIGTAIRETQESLSKTFDPSGDISK
jgi:hypothetical protein